MFQDPGSSLNPRQTVEQLVSRPLRLFRDDVGRSQERETVVALLESVKPLARPARTAIRGS